MFGESILVNSNLPLIKHGRITASSTWQTLLKLDSDPNRSVRIRKITIQFSSVAGSPSINVHVNGEPLLRDFQPVVAETTLDFGGDLVFQGKTDKPPILVEVRDTGATPNVTCLVTGVQLPYVPSRE